MLTSCSPPTYDIITTMDNGRIIFTGRDSQGTSKYVEASSVSVSAGGERLWAIAYQRTEACGYTPRGSAPFPLTYGEVPACWEQSVAPAALRNGVTYTVDGYAGSRRGSGDFRITETGVESIDTLSNY